MRGVLRTPTKIVGGLFLAALYAMPQGYTISARPGVINYIEGTAYLNGKHISEKTPDGRTYLGVNETLSTGNGKAEMLLTPGVFVRLGENSEVRMISPTLTNTKVEVTKGNVMVEVGELVKENDVSVLNHGSNITLKKVGLYRFSAGDSPSAAVLEGKADVELDGKKVSLGKDHQTVLASQLKSERFKSKDENDDLYAWSKTRDQYDSAASFASARTLSTSGFTSGGGLGYGSGYGGLGSGYGYGSGYGGMGGPGWMWNSMFNSYAWLPGDGAFFSPFGYGFFSPGYVAYAPLMYLPMRGYPGGVAVPVNPGRLPVTVATTGGARPAIYTASGRPYQSSPVANALVGNVNATGGTSQATPLPHGPARPTRRRVGPVRAVTLAAAAAQPRAREAVVSQAAAADTLAPVIASRHKLNRDARRAADFGLPPFAHLA